MSEKFLSASKIAAENMEQPIGSTSIADTKIGVKTAKECTRQLIKLQDKSGCFCCTPEFCAAIGKSMEEVLRGAEINGKGSKLWATALGREYFINNLRGQGRLWFDAELKARKFLQYCLTIEANELLEAAGKCFK